ncbi:hypothetical protein [Lentilitoribacter sp. Alg239-R112]|uniref:hypothetical protein n=1 Tax=Lentilitoribacter sp. Alg239-R112 TaxID=2305987 RepID=UPI0013A6ED6E|nr:hypothetical protein [Lentilitoribacter sp. Alg239-R112]
MKSIALILSLVASSAFAGESYCNDGSTFHIETIPHGFAVVRINKADYCKRVMSLETGEMSERFICDGREDYQLDFLVEGDELILTQTDGNEALFSRCQ